MKLSYFPQLKVIHTSKIFHGQLYIPLANWLLMVGTILVASIYNNVWSSRFFLLRIFLTPPIDYVARKCIRCLCYVCHILRYVYGLDDSHIRVASKSIYRYSPMARHCMPGWHIPLFRSHKSARRRLVHAHARIHSRHGFHAVTIWQRATVVRRGRGSISHFPLYSARAGRPASYRKVPWDLAQFDQRVWCFLR